MPIAGSLPFSGLIAVSHAELLPQFPGIYLPASRHICLWILHRLRQHPRVKSQFRTFFQELLFGHHQRFTSSRAAVAALVLLKMLIQLLGVADSSASVLFQATVLRHGRCIVLDPLPQLQLLPCKIVDRPHCGPVPFVGRT